MNDHMQLLQHDGRAMRQYSNVSKGQLDLLVLRYMVRRLHIMLPQFGHLAYLSQPMLYTLQERHGHAHPLLYHLQERRERTHRIALYQYQELSLHSTFPFVGFVSRRQKELSPWVIDEIQKVDALLVEELVGNSGILSYSSLQLGNGDWYNLVIMQNVAAKTHLKQSTTHAYAAYHLSTHYYEWIRLHTGLLLEGLDHTHMQLHKTRHYVFQGAQQSPSIHEDIYGMGVSQVD